MATETMATETMATEQGQVKHNPDDVDMKEQSFHSFGGDDQLPTSSSFQLSSQEQYLNDNRNTNNVALVITPCKSSEPQPQTPSIPNTQLRNLTISTPIENKTENKENKTEIEEIESNTNNAKTHHSLINDANAYISIIDNKRLAKISQINANKTYNRIQAKDVNKFKSEIQSILNNAIHRKKKKLQNNDKNNKVSDDEKKNNAKNKSIPNKYKLAIIEKALTACYAQLVNLNERFLQPAQNTNHIKPQSNKQQMSENKKEIKMQIKAIKTQINERREKLMDQIQMLNTLRSKTKEIEIEIPQQVKNKMVKNINYNNENNNNIISPLKQERTMEIVAMINDNKKKKMLEFKSKFDQLKENEIRLKKKAEKIKNDQEEINRFIELKNQNMKNNNNNNMEVDDNENKNRNVRLSMASSIESTIHGAVSSDIFDKFNRKQIKQKLSFTAMQNVSNGDPNWLQTNDIDL